MTDARKINETSYSQYSDRTRSKSKNYNFHRVLMNNLKNMRHDNQQPVH